jgi:glycosyltransferase involved in cell wall biosynthesis
MDISIIICTYNRASILRETLESFLLIQRPSDTQIEVIIVDNNSNDDTAAVSKEFSERNPGVFRYIKESVQGLSFARNCGIRSSRAELIAFVDDDIYFDPRWLVEMVGLFRGTGAMCAGGRSIPHFEASKPNWISTDLLVVYGSTNSGDAVKRMIFPEHPFGLNMVFNREIFKVVGLFNVTLGRVKNSLLSNEESDLFLRIDRANLPVFYTPHAIVHHRIPEARTRKSWVLKRMYYQGISDVTLRQILARIGRRKLFWAVCGSLLQMLKLAKCALRLSVTGSGDLRTSFGYLSRIYYEAGLIAGKLQQIFRRHRTGAVAD